MEIEIKGVITDVHIGVDGFTDEFIDWPESKGYAFCGSIGPYQEEDGDKG